MKKTFRLLFVIALIATALFALCLVASAEVVGEGECGEDLTWSYDDETFTLTISGTGEMEDYSYYSSAPWYQYSYEIEYVVITEGVTSIGDYAFEDHYQLERR